ncbi:HvfC/BufC N-terminal domain-containing protein [Ancylobacter lacus]|uniref:HvfC/BufC N-terminal domain-containing protein n=1 Tax=Ancylobacter lacus TaxID=2579970 RepID=UPI001BCBB265|nr:DNA-binding domain-containing protein [Ancylobacter lacus]MBS7538034.1 putative DNA-binding domain-containing protein [Ancylobacter lacus]
MLNSPVEGAPLLADRQRDFGAALLDPEAPVPEGVHGSAGRADARRFAVYRNNVMVGLTEALAARFPVCGRLVGDAFFRAMARVYVGATKPRSPLLMRYGDGFPDFIAGFGPAGEVPYLADVARLEWAWGEAYHAAEAVAASGTILATVPAEAVAEVRLALHPSLRLVASPYPVLSIWLAHQGDDPSGEGVEWRAENVVVVRPDADVLMHRLSAGGVAFLEALLRRRTLGEAAEAALGADAGFDAGGHLVGLFTLGAVTGLVNEADGESVS